MRTPAAILFDLWGTLVDSVAFDAEPGNAVLLARAENPRAVTLEEIQEMGRRLVTATIPREEGAAIEFTQVALFRILADSFGLRFQIPLPDLEWEFWDASLTTAVRPGVVEMLQEIRQRGIRSSVISNSSFGARTIEKELERLGILRYFEFVISSADYGIRKPDALIFEAALRRMGVAPAQSWFIGDNIGYDIIGAHRAGLFPVAYNVHGVVPESVGEYFSLSHWRELVDLLEARGDEIEKEAGYVHRQA